MRTRKFGNPAITGRAFERIARAVMFGLACGGSGCSGAAPGGRSLTTGNDRTASAADSGAGGSAPSSGGGGAARSAGTPGAGGTAGASASGGVGAAAGASGASSSAPDPGSDAVPDAGSPGSAGTDGGRGSDDGAADGGRGTIAPPTDDPAPMPCTDRWADCNGVSADGCEVDVSSNTTHCGTCGRACSNAGAVTTACADGECKPTCDPQHADCDGNPVNGCEVDVSTNRNSCGACGHDCRGGACVDGQCQPTAVAKGLSIPMLLTVLDGVPYVVEFNSTVSGVQLVHIDAGGSAVHSLTFTGNSPAAMASHGTNVYLAIPGAASAGDAPSGEIAVVDTRDGSFRTLKGGIDPISLAVDDVNFYWGDATDSAVYRQGLAGDTAIQVGLLAAGALVSDGTTLFGASAAGDEMFSVPVGGGRWSPRAKALNNSGESWTVATHHVALDAQHAYVWYSDSAGLLHLCETLKPGFRFLYELASSTADSGKGPMVSDGTYVYFRKEDGLYRAATTGAHRVTLVAKVVGQITDLAIDDGVLYWLDGGNEIADGSLNRLVL